MKLLQAPPFDNSHSNRELPRVIREFHALRATTIDARRFSILVAHWPGILVVNGRLAVNDDLRRGGRITSNMYPCHTRWSATGLGGV